MPQQNVPIPKRPGAKPRHPFRAMERGDFFFVARERNNLMSQAWRWGDKLGRSYITRMMWARWVQDEWRACKDTDEGATRGVGVWRVR